MPSEKRSFDKDNNNIKIKVLCVACALKILPLSDVSQYISIFAKEKNYLPSKEQINFFENCNSLEMPFNFDDQFAQFNSKYVNIDELNSLLGPKTFEILHLNIASIYKYFDDLSIFLRQLNKPVKIIGVTEHKIKKGDQLNKTLHGYNFVFNSSSSTHGGAGIFISDDLQYKVRADLDFTTEDLCESIQSIQRFILGG